MKNTDDRDIAIELEKNILDKSDEDIPKDGDAEISVTVEETFRGTEGEEYVTEVNAKNIDTNTKARIAKPTDIHEVVITGPSALKLDDIPDGYGPEDNEFTKIAKPSAPPLEEEEPSQVLTATEELLKAEDIEEV